MSEPTIFIDYFNRSCGEFLIEQKNSLSTYPQYFYIEHISFMWSPFFTELQSETIQHYRQFCDHWKKEDITIVQTADLAAARTREQEYLAIIEKYEDIESQLDLHTSYSAIQKNNTNNSAPTKSYRRRDCSDILSPESK